MASLICDPNGLKRIQFTGKDGGRKTIRLGKISVKQAETMRRFIEELITSANTGSPISPATAEWVATRPLRLRRRLERFELAAPQQRREQLTYSQWTERYIAGRPDVKPNTLKNYWQAHNLAAGSFGDKLLSEITRGDADAFRASLKSQGYSEGFTRRRCGIVRQFFTAAIRAKMMADNPFDGVKCGNYADASRFHFVSRKDAQAVLDACPDAQWRLIFALCRYGGLRCPSEVLALRWGDIDWEHDRFTVHASKTEHHDGGGIRLVPIFPELLPHLRECFELAEPGSERVVTRYADSNQNLRTQLERIIARAGLSAWPKLFQNLRSTRETELCEEFPDHVVTKWLGNSVAVARKHYLQVTDEHFASAAKGKEETGAKAAQKAAQQHAADSIIKPQGQEDNSEEPVIAGVCNSLQDNALEAYARQDSNL